MLNVSESEPTVEVCLELTNATAELLRPLVFYVFSVDGTASSEFYTIRIQGPVVRKIFPSKVL